MMEQKKQEIKYLNIAKGWLILSVVVGHTAPPFTDLVYFVYLFSMTGLIYLSGYFTQIDTSTWQSSFSGWGRRVGKLYLYYLKYELLFLALKNFFLRIGFYGADVEYGGKFVTSDSWADFFRHSFFCVMGMGREVFAAAFWYFISLIFIVTLFVGIKYVAERQRLVAPKLFCALMVLLCFSVGCLFKYMDVCIPRLSQSFTLMLPFYFGYAQRNYGWRPRFDCVWLSLLSFVGLAVMVRYGHISMNSNMFPDPFFFLIATSLGIYGVVGLSKWMEVVLPHTGNLLRYLGKNSLAIMVFHLLAFKAVFVLQYLSGAIEWCDVATLNAMAFSWGWFVLYVVCGVFLPIPMFRGCEFVWNWVVGKIRNHLFR